MNIVKNTVNEKNLILTRAKSAVLSRDFATAARLYKQLLKNDPSNVDYLKELGSIYVKNGEDAKAIPYYEQIITFYPHYVEAMNSLGAIYRRLKRYEDSINILQKALDEDRQTGSVNYNLGFTYKEMGNYDDAIEAFEIVINENPSDVLAYNHLGKIYFEKKDYAKAISSYKKGLQVDQNHPILNYNLAVCYDEAKMYTEAIRCYEAALKAKPGWVDAIRDFSNLLITCQRTKEASDLVHRSIELYPNDSQLLCLLGRIYISQFDYDSAIKTYKKASVFAENDIRILSGLADALEKGEKPQEALDSVIKAMELEPDNKDLKKQYVHTLLSAEEYESAGINLQELENEPDGAKDLQVLDLGEQYSICVNDEEKAKEYSDRINKINKHYKNHIIEAAGRYAQIGNNEMAEKKAKEFVAREIRNPAGYNMLGKIYTNSGDLENALDSYDKSRNLRKPNILADKQIKKLSELMHREVPPEPAPVEEEPVETLPVEESPAVIENEEAEAPQEDDFDFSQLGGNVPMQEALVEEEKEFFDNLDENIDEMLGEEEPQSAEAEPESEPVAVQAAAPLASDGDGTDSTLAGAGDNGDGPSTNVSNDARGENEDNSSPAVNEENGDKLAADLLDDEEEAEDFDFGQFDEKGNVNPEDKDDFFDDEPYETGENGENGDNPYATPAEEPSPEPAPQFQPPLDSQNEAPEPSYKEPPYQPYQPQYQPDPYVEEMQKRMQDAMMQSSRFAMDTAMEAQKLANKLADEQEILKNRLNEMEEKQNDLEEKQEAGFYSKLNESVEEEEPVVEPEPVVEAAPILDESLADAEPDTAEPVAGAEPVTDEALTEDFAAVAEETEDTEDTELDLEEPDTGTFVGNEMLTEDETESLIGADETDEIPSAVSFVQDDLAESEEIKFATVDEMLKELSQEPEDLIPEVDDVADIDFDAIEDEAVEESEPVEAVEEAESNASSLLSSAKELLPTIEKVIEDDEEAMENAPQIDMFRKLLSLSEYLPDDEKEKFRSGKQRMQMEYLISKMSGKPGLLKTSQSLRKAGILGEVADNLRTDESGNVSNQEIKDVIGIMKKLSASLDDKNLAKALCSSADNVLEKIELEDKKAQIFVD